MSNSTFKTSTNLDESSANLLSNLAVHIDLIQVEARVKQALVPALELLFYWHIGS